MADMIPQGEPVHHQDHPATSVGTPSPGLMDYVGGAMNVYKQLGSDLVAQGQGKKLVDGEYK